MKRFCSKNSIAFFRILLLFEIIIYEISLKAIGKEWLQKIPHLNITS